MVFVFSTIQYNTIQYIWIKEGVVTPEQDVWLTFLAPEQGILFGFFPPEQGEFEQKLRQS